HRINHFHLNLKPSNILVGQNDEIKITDFLIPKSLYYDQDDYGGGHEHFHYMAPEQIHGQRGDSRSDVFSLGVVLFQTATNTHPFTSQNLRDIPNNILHKAAPSPSEFNNKTPKFCEAFILKCLAKDPAKRFQSVEQMVTLLKKTFESKLFSNFNYQIAQSRDSY
ncbi:protein kinase, partial [candidate division KSB1 bacterium]|nr:protein kinase [candidate division KSB1 bacterium]